MFDKAILENLKRERFSAEDMEAIKTIDPVKYEIFKHRLYHLLDEARETVKKLGSSTVIRDTGEIITGVYTAAGDLALCSSTIFLHVIGCGWAIRYTLKYRKNEPGVGIYDEDQFWNNDSWYGGQHACDHTVFTPLFYKDEIIAWSACLTHSSAVGACEPGGMPVSATNRYMEGIRLPCVKVIERGKKREDILDMIASFSRDPGMMMLDAAGRFACNVKVRSVFKELLDKYGPEFVKASLKKMIYESEERCKFKVSQLNDGIYNEVCFQDEQGQEYGIIKINLSITKKNEKLYVDLLGSSPPQPGPMNMTPSVVAGAFFTAVAHQLFWDVDWNVGLLGPFEWKIPENSLCYPKYDSAINQAVCIGTVLAERVRRCLSKMMYDSPYKEDLVADCGGVIRVPYFGGIDQYGKPCSELTLTFNAGAEGAMIDENGQDAGGIPAITRADMGDAESWEHITGPILFLARGYLKDSGGAGKYRGGNALWEAHKIHGVPELWWGSLGQGDKINIARGFGGGYPPPTSRNLAVFNNNFKRINRTRIENGELMLPPFYSVEEFLKMEGDIYEARGNTPATLLKEDDIWIQVFQGSAGLGDPLEADPESVMKDIREGMVSHWMAKNVYLIEYDEKTLRVEQMATERKREQKRRERIKKSMKYDEYLEKIKKVKPDGKLLKTYGAWP